jgi:predicted nucleic acid-binding protein
VIVLDASGLISAIDGAQRHHAAAAAALSKETNPPILSPFVLAETDYLLATRVGVDAELALLREVATGAYQLATFEGADIEAAVEIIERYRDFNVGLTGASIVMLAARYTTNRILTLDERHFRAMRPLRRGAAFRLLPQDA